MKAYKQWYNKKIKPHLSISKHGPGIGIAEVFQEAREETWRAALEWFYDKLDYSIEHEELKDIIEEELEDEN